MGIHKESLQQDTTLLQEEKQSKTFIMKTFSLYALLFVIALIISETLAKPVMTPDIIEESNGTTLVIFRLRRHQADKMFGHYRRKERIKLMRQYYLRYLLKEINEKQEGDENAECKLVKVKDRGSLQVKCGPAAAFI